MPMPMPSRKIEDQFIATYVEDAKRHRVRRLVDYQSLFPGHETTIAREYRLLEEDELGDTGSATTGGHVRAAAPQAAAPQAAGRSWTEEAGRSHGRRGTAGRRTEYRPGTVVPGNS